MNKLQYVALILFISIWQYSNAQRNIPEVDFSGIEPLLKKNADTTYIVHFWATWCTPCRNEIPNFVQAYDKVKENKVKFYFISLDFPKQKESSLIPFIEKIGLPEQNILLNDPRSNGWIDKVDPSWSGSIPATLIYRKNTRKFIEGETTYEQLISIINEISNSISH